MAQALPQIPMAYYPPIEPSAYAPPSQFYPSTQSYSVPYANYASSFVDRTKPDRKRPKYTRSKTGCLTCRRKKVKCDESKPHCQRCVTGQFECTWPEFVPKKSVPQRRKVSEMSTDAPSSSHSSTTSFSVGSQATPTMRLPDAGLLNVVNADTRRHSEPQIFVPIAMPAIAGRRHTLADIMDGQQSPASVSIASSRNVSTTGPSTPPDFLFTNTQDSPNLSMSVLPIANSRPSTANSVPSYVMKSSHSLSHPGINGHSFPYSTPDVSTSRPSTANSQGVLSHPRYSPNLHHSGSALAPAYNTSPSIGQSMLDGYSLDRGLNAVAIANYSRPSTAGSVSIGTGSPLQVPNETEIWCPPLPPSMPTMQPQGAILQGHADSYYPPSVHTPPQHSRPHSPWMG